MLKKRIKILFGGVVFFVILILGTQLYVKTHRKELAEYALEQINNQLTADLSVNLEEVDISILDNFPQISLSFPDLEIKSQKTKQSVIQVSFLELTFSIIDVLFNKPRIEALVLSDGKVNLIKDTKGYLDFDLISKKKDTPIQLGFNHIILNDISIQYKDYTFSNTPNTDLQILFNHFKVQMSIENNIINGDCSGEVLLDHLNTGGQSYFSQSEAELSGAFSYDLVKQLLKVDKLNHSIAGMEASSFGSLDFKEKGYSRIDWTIKDIEMGRRDWHKLCDHLHLESNYNHYWTEGDLKANVQFQGIVARWKNPKVIIEIFGEKVKLQDGVMAAGLNDFAFNFILDNGKLKFSTDSLLLTSFAGNFDAKIGYDNTSLEDFWVDLSGDFDLGVAKKADLLPELVSSLNGKYSSNRFRVYRRDNQWYVSGSGKLINLNLSYGEYDFKCNESLLSVDNESVIFSSESFSLNDQKGAMNLIYDIKSTHISGGIDLKNFNLNKLIAASEGPINLHDKIQFNLRLKGEDIQYNNLRIESLDMHLKNEKGYFASSGYKLKMMGGIWQGSGQVHQFQDDNLYFKLDGRCQNVDLNALFNQMDNFNQDAIKAEQLRGFATSDYQVDFQYDNQLNLLTQTIDFKGDVQIQKGELVKFRPMMALSSYIEIEELKHIKFSDVNNRLEIYDGIIHLPKTRINSNAFNIELFGTHSFENIVDYDLRLHLGDILSRKKKKFQNHASFDTEGRASLYLKMQGDIRDPKVRYNSRAVSTKVKEDFKKQGKSLKKAFRKEFGKNHRLNTELEDEHEDEELEYIEWDDK